MENSFKVRLASKIVRKARFILHPIKNAYQKHLDLSDRRTYHAWAVHNELECFVVGSNNDHEPLVSIVVPAYNTTQTHLLEMVYSVCNQHYQNWELVIVNASDNEHSRQNIDETSSIDTRIKIIDARENHGIAQNTNIGIEAASGEYVAFLDHDDVLHPCALHTLMDNVEQEGTEVVYSDEDKITHDSKYYFGPHCKPDWSPHLLENVNYINHLTIIKKKHLEQVKGLRHECNGAQDYDLLFRVIDICKPKIGHVSRVLYHWRAAQTSTARNISTKTYIFEAGKKAVQDHLDRRGIQATAKVIAGKPGFYEVQYEPTPSLCLVIGVVEPMKVPAAAFWINELLHDLPLRTELIVPEQFEGFIKETNAKNHPIQFISSKNYLKKAAEACTAETVVYLQDAVTSRDKHGIITLASVAAAQNDQTLVQPLVVNQNETIKDGGYVDSSHGLEPLFKGNRPAENTFFGNTDWVRNVAAVSCRVMALSKKTFTDLAEASSSQQYFRSTDIPKDFQNILWAHTVFKYESYLQSAAPRLSNFNGQLAQAHGSILMKDSKWDKEKDREHA